MNYMTTVISEHSLTADPDHLVVDVRIPWYRSLPLSCVADVAVAIDGAPVALDGATLTVDGTTYRLDELADQVDVVWYIQDLGRLAVPMPGGVEIGAQKELTVRLDFRIPYIIVGPGTALNQSATNTITLTARAADDEDERTAA